MNTTSVPKDMPVESICGTENTLQYKQNKKKELFHIL
jgi:hypothetical protein